MHRVVLFLQTFILPLLPTAQAFHKETRSCQHNTYLNLKIEILTILPENFYTFWFYRWPSDVDWSITDPSKPDPNKMTLISEAILSTDEMQNNPKNPKPEYSSLKRTEVYRRQKIPEIFQSKSFFDSKPEYNAVYNHTSIKSLRILCDLYTNDEVYIYFSRKSRSDFLPTLLTLTKISIFLQPTQVTITKLYTIQDSLVDKKTSGVTNFKNEIDYSAFNNISNYQKILQCETFSKPNSGFLWTIKAVNQKYDFIESKFTKKQIFNKVKDKTLLIRSTSTISIPMRYQFSEAEITCIPYFRNDKSYYKFKELAQKHIMDLNFAPKDMTMDFEFYPRNYLAINCDDFASPRQTEKKFSVYLNNGIDQKAINLMDSEINEAKYISYNKKINQLTIRIPNDDENLLEICQPPVENIEETLANITSLSSFTSRFNCVLSCRASNVYGHNSKNLTLDPIKFPYLYGNSFNNKFPDLLKNLHENSKNSKNFEQTKLENQLNQGWALIAEVGKDLYLAYDKWYKRQNSTVKMVLNVCFALMALILISLTLYAIFIIYCCCLQPLFQDLGRRLDVYLANWKSKSKNSNNHEIQKTKSEKENLAVLTTINRTPSYKSAISKTTKNRPVIHQSYSGLKNLASLQYQDTTDNENFQSALLDNTADNSDETYKTVKNGQMSPKTQGEWQQLDIIFGNNKNGVKRDRSDSQYSLQSNIRNIPNYYSTLQTSQQSRDAMFNSKGFNCLGQRTDYQMDSPYNEHKLYFTAAKQ